MSVSHNEACQVSTHIYTKQQNDQDQILYYNIGLGDYQLCKQYCHQMRSIEEMHLIPALPVDEIVTKIRSEVDANIEKSKCLETFLV